MTHYQVRGIIGGLRNATAEGVVASLDDSGQAMTLTVSTGDGVDRAEVEVATPWGFNSSPPSDGMLTVLLALGGDPANMRALHPHNPACRFGALQVGEAVIYGADGCRVHIQAGLVKIVAPLVHVVGNLSVTGNLTVSGTIS